MDTFLSIPLVAEQFLALQVDVQWTNSQHK